MQYSYNVKINLTSFTFVFLVRDIKWPKNYILIYISCVFFLKIKTLLHKALIFFKYKDHGVINIILYTFSKILFSIKTLKNIPFLFY